MMNLICKDCGKPFSISDEEQAWFEDKGFNIPVRCRECRAYNKLARTIQDNMTSSTAVGDKAIARVAIKENLVLKTEMAIVRGERDVAVQCLIYCGCCGATCQNQVIGCENDKELCRGWVFNGACFGNVEKTTI